MERSGRIVTTAALIVVVVAGSFAFADIVLIKALGLGVAIAVALDATVVRALLVPSTMRLLGDWNWWMPDSLKRFIDTACTCPRRRALAARALAVAALVVRLLARRPRAWLTTRRRRPIPRPPTASRPAPDPQPVVLPRDEAAHDRLTEWWYYTGHLRESDDGRKFGFEFVIFRAERGSLPGHLGIASGADRRVGRASSSTTSAPRSGRRSINARRRGSTSRSAAPSDQRRARSGALAVADVGARRQRHAERGSSAQISLDLELDAVHDAPALHDGDGWIDFGPAGGVVLLLVDAHGRERARSPSAATMR